MCVQWFSEPSSFYRHGFNNQAPMSLAEVSRKFNITRSRIEQIEAKALWEIRRSKYIKPLASYKDDSVKALENIESFRAVPYKTYKKK